MTIAQTRVWEEDVLIPTYGTGKADQNPMFLEKRVYQGSSGKVYPHAVIDKILDHKELQAHRLVFLENEYLHIAIMPDLGGRVYRALDKTNGYDFVYYNRVIKPALVGLTGPWISGGIEFNWPQHHRPNTYGPVEYMITQNSDGSKTVWVSEIDRMYGTKMNAGFTLHPGKAYLEIQVQLYNRTPLPQTFLWWANPAVAANDHTQSIFPPDVHAVFDHGKRDVSRFPIATGTYYKVDYSRGVDISQHKNIPVPTSYMAYRSDYDFIGGYDHARQAGILHVANHHIAPGKKQWTWGNGEFGTAWDRNLTDEDGPYVELMVGVYTDNQPDFSWLQPYEEKSFTQYFLPYKHLGNVKNASIDAAINLEIDTRQQTAHIQVYATALFTNAAIKLTGKRQIYLNENVTLSPLQVFSESVALAPDEQAHDLLASVTDATGRNLIHYQPTRPMDAEIPAAAIALASPVEISTNEALYLAGLHLEQYRHATFAPEDYYQEGLTRDPDDVRINIAYGTLLLRRGLFHAAEKLLRTATTTIARHNPNPYDGEAYHQLGLTLKFLGRLDEARATLYKAIWSAAWQASGYFTLAQITCEQHSYQEALQLVEQALASNTHNYRARHLQIALLRKLDHFTAASTLIEEAIALDIAHSGAYYEQFLLHLAMDQKELATTSLNSLQQLLRKDIHSIIALATDYAQCGLYEEASDVLNHLASDQSYPMRYYYQGYFYDRLGQPDLAQTHWQVGKNAPTDYCFPNSLDDLLVLERVIAARPDDARAHYYLGNLLYDKKRYHDAIQHWEAARTLDETFATVHRNLALAYYNRENQPEQARISLEKAFACNPEDARVLYELDQLYRRMGQAPAARLEHLTRHWELVTKRDDLSLEYITLLNNLQHYEQASDLLTKRIFHPWEGGEGKVTGQYIFTHIESGKQQLTQHEFEEALTLFEKARMFPTNLGEGRLAGAQENNIDYYLGCTYEHLGKASEAHRHFLAASHGLEEPASVMFYNDQPPDMIFYQGLAWLKLGNPTEARQRFQKLIEYGKSHLNDDVKIDYFAVSLPDFLVFEDNLKTRNQIHCHYMMGLGYLGQKELEQAQTHFLEVLHLDANHQGAIMHRRQCS